MRQYRWAGYRQLNPILPPRRGKEGLVHRLLDCLCTRTSVNTYLSRIGVGPRSRRVSESLTFRGTYTPGSFGFNGSNSSRDHRFVSS